MQKKGFTLIELLVVISVIGVLSTIIVGSIMKARNKADDVKFVSGVNSLRVALEMYYLDNNSYPITDFSAYKSDAGLLNGLSFYQDTIDSLDGYFDLATFAESLPNGFYLNYNIGPGVPNVDCPVVTGSGTNTYRVVFRTKNFYTEDPAEYYTGTTSDALYVDQYYSYTQYNQNSVSNIHCMQP